MNKKIMIGLVLVLLVNFSYFAFAEGVTDAEIVGSLDVTVCCEKTVGGLDCQDVPAEDCRSDSRALPTSCEETSFCNPGFCVDSTEGICLDNVAQIVCNEINEGIWFEEEPLQCGLGCCILGDQASFVTLVRCKRLSSFYSLETNWNSEIGGEAQCILSARSDEKGACVFQEDFETGCKMTTRSECTSERMLGTGGGTIEETTEDTGGSLIDNFVPAPNTGGDEETPEDGTGGGAPEAQQFSIDIKDIAYSQKTITIKVGDTITWTNLEAVEHTVTSSGGGNELNSRTMNEGDTFSHTFNEEGTFDYDCLFHPEVQAMKATVIVEAVQLQPEVGEVIFHPGTLCTAQELGTVCGKSKQTECLPGREEVYFIDTCGNPANIYDARRVNDDSYWNDILDKSESCDQGSGNADSQTCGNCNYLLGSFCRVADSETGTVSMGDNICADLNCVYEGEKKIHGESWCLYDDENHDFAFDFGEEDDSELNNIVSGAIGDVTSKTGVGEEFLGSAGGKVGSKFYRLSCNNGEVLVDTCAEFRQEECIENDVAGFSEAACVVNRWQDCTAQFKKDGCENSDRRDCNWLSGIEYVLMGGLANSSNIGSSSLSGSGAVDKMKAFETGEREIGACVPKIPPGLRFWGDEGEEGQSNTETVAICSQANFICPVTFERGITGGDWECIENCECLEEATHVKRAQLCMSLGDCGPKTNYIDRQGSGIGYRIFEQDLDDD